MDNNHPRNEIMLYCLAFLLALAIRLYQLGASPLSDIEAQWALQALSLAHGEPVILGPQPAYLLLTSQLFSIFGNTNFMAILCPSLDERLALDALGWCGDGFWPRH
jgi:predicted membrane-bound mannosyltransferase